MVFPAGSENRVCVDWPIVDDSTSGGDQTISISISPPSIAGVVIGDGNTSNITIKDDDGRHLHVHAANNIYAVIHLFMQIITIHGKSKKALSHWEGNLVVISSDTDNTNCSISSHSAPSGRGLLCLPLLHCDGGQRASSGVSE